MTPSRILERRPEGATSTRGRAFGVVPAGVLAIVLLAMLVVHGAFYETFTVPSSSMEPALRPGDRIVVDKRAEVHRGAVVVFSGEGSMYQEPPRDGLAAVVAGAARSVGFRPFESDYVKRVIGVGGDRVAVDGAGRLLVNGRVQHEPYLPRGRKASAQPFAVTVPGGKLFVLGDNRDDSDDSRNHLGDPGGGFVPASRVVGVLTWKYWPRP